MTLRRNIARDHPPLLPKPILMPRPPLLQTLHDLKDSQPSRLALAIARHDAFVHAGRGANDGPFVISGDKIVRRLPNIEFANHIVINHGHTIVFVVQTLITDVLDEVHPSSASNCALR
jgi:hypothetical protein